MISSAVVIVMTSNLGSQDVRELGGNPTREEVRAGHGSSVATFRPEFINCIRIGGVPFIGKSTNSWHSYDEFNLDRLRASFKTNATLYCR